MGRKPSDPSIISATVMVNRTMYNIITQRGASPRELLNMAMAAYLQIDLEQEVRYESILRTKKQLQNNDLVAYRQQIEDIAQQKLLAYTKIEEENKIRGQIAKCLQEAVQDETFRAKISRDVEVRQWDSVYLENIITTLHRAVLKEIPEDKLRECIMSTIKNNWAPVLLETT